MKFAFEYFLFVGWLTASDAMGNPFRCWADELEWINFVKRISKSSLMIALDYGDRSLQGNEEEQKEQNTLFVKTCDMWQSPQFYSKEDGSFHEATARQMLTGF